MLDSFRTYQISLELYRAAEKVKGLRYDLKDQLLRASSSICLNLAEGSAKPTVKDRKKFYFIALGSCREVQTVIEMKRNEIGELHALADRLGGSLYRLTRS